ncbi:hypothetical protein BKA70DRAFT_1450673 [Coprinopsis sp. MPI-PUGE-AT-0042]|nr:hypothetical protein BKA70DRAFT_1450673 [Coprinopsis sp. MPI-PUGE-AT-0042]
MSPLCHLPDLQPPEPPVRERNALLDGKLVRVVLLSDLAEDITPLRFEDVDWDAWDDISPGDLGEDELDDDLSERVTRISLGRTGVAPWTISRLKLASSRRAAYVVYFGRRMGVFITWEATTMQVCGFKYNSYQGYDTLEEARSHWMHALATGTWGDPRRGGDRSIPPFEGYHIVYDSSVDPYRYSIKRSDEVYRRHLHHVVIVVVNHWLFQRPIISRFRG